MSLESDIREHWDYSIVKNYCKVNQTNRKPKDEFPYKEFDYVTVSCVDGEAGKIEKTEKEIGKDAPSRAKREVHKGDVIVSTIRPYLRAFAIVPEDLDGAICSTAFAVLTPQEDILSEFLWYAVRFEDFVNQLKKKQRGASYPAVGIKDVKNSKIPVPPVDEQKAIVKKLDSIFGNIEELKDAQEKVEEIMEKIPRTIVEDLLPESVEYSTIGECTEESLYGLNSRSSEDIDGYPFLRITDIKESGSLPEVPKKVDISEEDFMKYKLDVGDLVVARSGTVGKSYVRKQNDPQMVYASYLIKFELDKAKVKPKYLGLILQSQRYWNWVENTKRNTAQANINAREIKEFEFPLPSKKKQEEILNYYGEIKTKFDDIVTYSFRRSEAYEVLSKSVVSEAFKGELVDFKKNSNPDG